MNKYLEWALREEQIRVVETKMLPPLPSRPVRVERGMVKWKSVEPVAAALIGRSGKKIFPSRIAYTDEEVEKGFANRVKGRRVVVLNRDAFIVGWLDEFGTGLTATGQIAR